MARRPPWKQSDDGLTWTFTLKEGVKFTDGTPVDAEAVAYNFDYWVERRQQHGQGLARRVLQVGRGDRRPRRCRSTCRSRIRGSPTTSRRATSASSRRRRSRPAPRRRTARRRSARAPSSSTKWNRGQDIILKRNENYTSWPANALHTGPAYVDEIDWKFVADPTTRVAALQSGQVDAIYDVPAVQWSTLKDGGYELEKYVTPGRPQQISFNTQVGPFTDEKVRQAFAYSLDRKQIVDTIGRGVIPFEGNGGVSQATPGYSKKAADWYTYDPDKANAAARRGRLDAEVTTRASATKDGKPLTVTLPYGAGSIINADGAAILQGVKEQASTGRLRRRARSRCRRASSSRASTRRPTTYDIAVGYWTAVTAGILYINWRPIHRRRTRTTPTRRSTTTTTLEGYILDGNSAADVDAQNAVYEKAQDYIAEHALAIGVYDRLSTLAVSPEAQGRLAGARTGRADVL